MTTFHTIILGNSHTIFDAQQMEGLLTDAKFTSVADVEKADVVIYSVCLVEEEKEQDFFFEFEKLRAQFPYKMIVIVGCLDPVQIRKLKGYAMLSSRKLHHIVEVVEELVHENVITYLQRDEMPSLLLPRGKREEFRVVVPIMRGCYDLFSFLFFFVFICLAGFVAPYSQIFFLPQCRTKISHGALLPWKRISP